MQHTNLRCGNPSQRAPDEGTLMSATESSAFESKAWLKHYAEWTPTTIEYGDTTLLDFYDNNLAINSDKPAIYFFGRTQTYGEFD